MCSQEIEQKIIDNEKLVYFVVHKYFKDLSNDEDIIQAGRIGLWKACEHYDDDKSKFSTFAVKCINNEIKNELRARFREKNKACVASLDQIIGVDEEFDSGVTIGNVIPFVEGGYSIIDHDLQSIEKKLPKRNADVFRMHVFGFSAAEISKYFGFSRTWASNLIRDVRSTFKKELFDI